MYLLPRPQKWKINEGVFVLEHDGKIVIDGTCGPEVFGYAGMLKGEMEESLGFGLDITRGRSKRAAVVLAVEDGMQEEEYRLEIGEKGVLVTGGAGAGVLYGIQTLRQVIRQKGACLPFMEIEDYPDFGNRGFYHDVTRGRIPTLGYLKELVDRLAFYKINQLQLYVEHSFLFEELSEVWRDDTPLTAEEIMELDRYCRERHVELIPSIASFGHLYKVLRTRTYRHLCELPEQVDLPFGFVDRMAHHTLDVTNPESLDLVKGLIGEYMELFTSKHFNICADETFDLGKGRSKELAKEKGVSGIYVDFVRQLCEFVVERGRIPMFWGDIICGFPETIGQLPKETICLNWGYDRDQTEESTRKLAQAGAVQYCCPGVSGWNELVNQMEAGYENIRRMCSYAGKYGAIGVLNTDWGDFGHINHPDFGIPGMIYGAAFSWNHRVVDDPMEKECRADSRSDDEKAVDLERLFADGMKEFHEMNREISRIEYRDSSERLVSLAAEIPEHWAFGWRHLIDYLEGAGPVADREQIARMPGDLEALERIKGQLYGLIPSLDSGKRPRVKPYLIAIEGMEVIQQIGALMGERDRLEEQCRETGRKAHWTKGEAFPGNVEPGALAVRLEEWFYQYKALWRSVSQESELYRIQKVINRCADALRVMEGK